MNLRTTTLLSMSLSLAIYAGLRLRARSVERKRGR